MVESQTDSAGGEFSQEFFLETDPDQLFGVGALAHRGLPPPPSSHRVFVREVPLASPHRTSLPVRAVQVTAVLWLRLGGNSGVQDALCYYIEWHEGFRHSETVAAESAG